MVRSRTKKKSTMVKAVRKIAREEALRVAETKMVGSLGENIQLYHNVPLVKTGFLASISKGVDDPTNMKAQNARIGNEIYLQEYQTKYWLSNKLDRPNVMYRLITFWYPTGGTPGVPTVTDIFQGAGGTLPNVMLLRLNTDVIKVISDKYVFSDANYAQPYYYPLDGAVAVTGKERSQLKFITNKFKSKKIKFDDASAGLGPATNYVKGSDICTCICAYDAYGTLTSDNIASYAVNWRITFKDP